MFDTIVHKRTEYEPVPYEKTVTINRAPTDESIKLFDEIKEKAYSSILKSISINNNEISITAVAYKDYSSMSVNCNYRFILNGKNNEGNIALDEFKLNSDNDYIYREIANNVSKHVTALICDTVLKSARINI